MVALELLKLLFRDWSIDNNIGLKLTCKSGWFHLIGLQDTCCLDSFNDLWFLKTTYCYTNKSINVQTIIKVYPFHLTSQDLLVDLRDYMNMYGRIYDYYEEREHMLRYYEAFHATFQKMMSLDWADIVKAEVVDYASTTPLLAYAKHTMHLAH